MKYKAGDRVRIKSLDWYNKNKDKNGSIYCGDGLMLNLYNAKLFCGRILTIKQVNSDFYTVVEDLSYWNDYMIEGLVEEEIKPKFKVGDKIKLNSTLLNDIFGVIGYESDGYRITNISNGLTDFMSYSIEHYYELVEEEVGLVDNFSSRWVNEFELPDGYIFKDENSNIINAQKIVLEKKHNDKLKLESTKTVREYWSEYARIYIEIYDDEPNECVLTHLYTLEGHRQKGYGKQALSEAESIAKELGCHTAYLKVETDSWMHKWYLRMGYKWYKTADKGYTWLMKNI